MGNDTYDWVIDSDVTLAIDAVYALRDMHIDASIADDSATAALANLLIEPTPLELEEGTNDAT